MTAEARPADLFDPAAADSGTVVGASGLTAAFNQAGVLSPLDVHAAAAAARLCGEEDQRAMLAAALAVRGARLGNVCIELAAQRESVAVEGVDPEAVDALPWPGPDEWMQALAGGRLAGGAGEGRPLVIEGGRLYLERYYRYEDLVGGLIEARAAAPPAALDPGVEEALERLLPPASGRGVPNLQHRAARTALSGRFTVIAGGPGTGKTYTVARLLAALAHGSGPFPRTALCAPTGKAAARLGEEAAEHAARLGGPIAEELEGLRANTGTIHRLLGWTHGRGRFRHNERNRLPHDLVIVDEMSMVSLPLAAKLLSAVRDDAAVVLVGDPYQLESIEAGTVLADITGPAAHGGDARSGRPPAPAPPIAARVVVLQRGRRYKEGGGIAALADAVRSGDAGLALEILGAGREDVKWVKDPSGEGFGALWGRLIAGRVRMVEAAKRPGGAAKALEQLRRTAVLCAHREGTGSVEHWRRGIESALDERFPGLRYGGPWYPGRPVMITSNDYNLNLYNGDIGAAAVRAEGGLEVVFDRGAAFQPGYLGDHATVHAMTIHKSQGSQFERVLVSLPPAASRLLTRELLYTAVTRASGSVTLIGGESVIRRAVERSVQRASGLGPRLWGRNDKKTPPDPRQGY